MAVGCAAGRVSVLVSVPKARRSGLTRSPMSISAYLDPIAANLPRWLRALAPKLAPKSLQLGAIRRYGPAQPVEKDQTNQHPPTQAGTAQDTSNGSPDFCNDIGPCASSAGRNGRSALWCRFNRCRSPLQVSAFALHSPFGKQTLSPTDPSGVTVEAVIRKTA
jgi:hypothetical protein